MGVWVCVCLKALITILQLSAARMLHWISFFPSDQKGKHVAVNTQPHTHAHVLTRTVRLLYFLPFVTALVVLIPRIGLRSGSPCWPAWLIMTCVSTFLTECVGTVLRERLTDQKCLKTSLLILTSRFQSTQPLVSKVVVKLVFPYMWSGWGGGSSGSRRGSKHEETCSLQKKPRDYWHYYSKHTRTDTGNSFFFCRHQLCDKFIHTSLCQTFPFFFFLIYL